MHDGQVNGEDFEEDECFFVWGYHDEHRCEAEIDHGYDHECVCGETHAVV